ncbi:MAG: hypothetical protein ACTSXS_12475 [Candidatus Thorarchaeota archaeon]
MGKEEPPSTVVVLQSAECEVCGQKAVVRCSSCGRAYCEDHFTDTTLQRISSNDEHICRCGICGDPICEYCWILDEEKGIVCIHHHK